MISVLGTAVAAHQDSVVLIHGGIRVVVQKTTAGTEERFYAQRGNEWILLLINGSTLRGDPAFKADGRLQPVHIDQLATSTNQNSEEAITLRGTVGGCRLTKTITLRTSRPHVRVEITLEVEQPRKITHLLSTYSFIPDGKRYPAAKRPDFIFTPQLRPEPEHVIADHTFRSPVLMMQTGRSFVGLLPDLGTIEGKNRPLRSIADVQVETADAPFFSFGLQNWIPEPYRLRNTHVYYTAPDSLSVTVSATQLRYGFYLDFTAEAEDRRPFRDLVRFQWDEYGRKNFHNSRGPQAEPFSTYIRKAWYEFVPQVALEVKYREQPVTLLRQGRLAWSNKLHEAANNDAWFNVWFNSLRTAYGMYLHGQRVGDPKLQSLAEGVLNLALLAPQRNGIAPSIFYYDTAGGHWVADHAWGGISNGEYLPMFHNAWTNCWLLQWSKFKPERKDEILRFTTSFANFLVQQQQESGVIPSWYHPETLEPAEPLREENAETAGAALFLAEQYAVTRNRQYLDAAEKGMQYIFHHILPENKWFDFETFFSCSRKPIGFFDRFTHQHPQNTLSMHQAVEACATLYRITGNPLYKEKGEEILDYLCLYQQVWSPAWLSCELFGGFGVQNTDGEWSDSRQGYFAVTLMKYYDITGRQEYFERGVAALRAMFSLFESPTSPRTAENYAHSGLNQLAGVTGLHWGTGSSVVSIHLITEQYGDAYVNVEEAWGVGIDGCRFTKVDVNGSNIDLRVEDTVHSPRNVRLKFDKLLSDRYSVTVNGVSLGPTSADQLRNGITITLQ